MPDYHIYTIPIWDAYQLHSECALCALTDKLEQQYLEAALGGGMMESDHRQVSNRLGYCGKHLRELYGMKAMLPLALSLDTHLLDVIESIEAPLTHLETAIASEEGLPLPQKAVRALRRGGDVATAALDAAQAASDRTQTCAICEKIETNLVRYIEALLHMWKTETEFAAAYAASKGVCMHHLPSLLRIATEKLSGAQRRAFLSDTAKQQRENMARVKADLLWFTKKFDHQNQDKPWGESQDAVPRTMLKLRGRVLDVSRPPMR